MGCSLNLKWSGLSVQSPLSTSTAASLPLSHSCRGKDGFCFWGRLFASSVLYGETEAALHDTSRTHAHSSSSSSYSGTRDLKLVPRKGSSDELHDHGVEIPKYEDDLAYLSSLNAIKTSQFRLLMKNLDVLENMFADSNTLRLENDILEQLQRLGAIHLFNSCLSMTLRSADLLLKTASLNDISDKVIIQSGKKELRKLRRKRSFDLETGYLSHQLTSESIYKDIQNPKPISRYKKQRITKSEADMATGFKLVAELERIRKRVEEESGEITSFSRWAEAAGIERKELKRRLNYGWLCRDELLKFSKPLVVFIARNYWGLGIAFEDLIQAGSMAVLHGAERFDQSRGYKFSTYVQYWIRKSMSMLVAKNSRGIRIPGTMSKVISQVQNARKSLCASTGKNPSDCEVAKFTGLSVEKIRSAGRCLRVVGSIDQKIGEFISTKFMEITRDETIRSPEEGVIREHMVKDVHKVLSGLECREREVLAMRFGLGNGNNEKRSLDEIGRSLSVSKEWIRKIERSALTKLRTHTSLNLLSHYDLYIH